MTKWTKWIRKIKEDQSIQNLYSAARKNLIIELWHFKRKIAVNRSPSKEPQSFFCEICCCILAIISCILFSSASFSFRI